MYDTSTSTAFFNLAIPPSRSVDLLPLLVVNQEPIVRVNQGLVVR